ncbi:MAG: M16 family metallopeptidase [Rhodothalassiaceae bacterium]
MSVRQTTLPNGLRIVSDRMAHLQSATIGVWIDVGARYESEEQNGITHLLEHMLFKGTDRRNARAIAEEIEAVGGHLNAYTSRDHTTFYAKVLKDDVPLAVDLLADILQHSQFDPVELEREREVILQEIGQVKDTPDDIVFDLLQEAAFPDQALGRSILGTEQSVAALDAEAVRRYRDAHYRGGTMVVAAAGGVDHDELVSLVAEAFADVPAGRARSLSAGAYGGGEIRWTRDLEQLHLTLGFPSFGFDDPDYYALHVYTTILGGGMSSRLFQELREVRGLAYTVHSFVSTHVETGLLGIYAGTDPDAATQIMPLLAHEICQLGQDVTVEEIARARSQLKAGLLMSLESTSARVEQMGRQLLVYDRILPIEELVDRVDAVDRAAVVRVGERCLTGGPVTMASIGPSQDLPAYEEIREAFDCKIAA